MSFDHKAFRFDWNSFTHDLSPILERALFGNEPQLLAEFIDKNFSECRNPYDGEVLEQGWRNLCDPTAVQELGDFALTKYYDPAEDCGLSGDWMELSERLLDAQQAALLGAPFAPQGHVFDPGRQGSYFQSPGQVRLSEAALSIVDDPGLQQFRELMRAAIDRDQGLYVTF